MSSIGDGAFSSASLELGATMWRRPSRVHPVDLSMWEESDVEDQGWVEENLECSDLILVPYIY